MGMLLLLGGVLSICPILDEASAQVGLNKSPFEREFGEVKFLDAYFGTGDEKIEVSPGDRNVPLTVVFANVGTQDITGIRGQLHLPMGFSSDEPDMLIEADAESNSVAGENFALTFFVNLDEHLDIQSYPASVHVEYSRLRESGVRNIFFDFDFRVTGDSIINIRALDPFLTSLRQNHVVIEISNDGTAPVSGVEIALQNTQGTISSTARSITNTENVVILDSDWDVGHIGPGTQKHFEFDVYIPESLKGVTLRTPMEITYFNAHGDRNVLTRVVDFYIKGLIDVSVYDVGVIELSGMQTIIGEIINEGNDDALFGFVKVEPLGDSNIRPTTQFIDEIEVDAPVPFNIPVQFDGKPRYGEHDILVTIRYKDNLRDEIFVTHEATILLNEPVMDEESGFDYLAYLDLAILPIAAIIGVVAFARIRKRRSRMV